MLSNIVFGPATGLPGQVLATGKVTKRPYNWSPGLIVVVFLTVFRARPVGTGLGAKFGREPANKQIKCLIVITYPKRMYTNF
jgi:hypothetical protein